jgi:hypothetical protein
MILFDFVQKFFDIGSLIAPHTADISGFFSLGLARSMRIYAMKTIQKH